MAEPQDLTVVIPRELREAMDKRFDKVDENYRLFDRRLQKIEDTLVNHGQALRADTFLSRLVTGEFEERIESLEKKVRQLETQK